MKREKLTKRPGDIELLIQQGNYTQAQRDLNILQGEGIPNLSLAQQGEFHYLTALLFSKLARYKEGLEHANASFELLRQTPQNEKIAKVHLVTGQLYSDSGDLKHAELELRDALAAYRRIGDQEKRIQVYNELARICFIKAEYTKAMEYLNEAHELSLSLNKPKLVAMILGNLGIVHIRLGDPKQAEQRLFSALDMCRQINDQDNIARFSLSLGYLFLSQRSFKQAESFFTKSRSIIEERGLTRELAIYHEYFAEYQLEVGNYEKAQEHIQEAIELGKRIAPGSSIMVQSYRVLAQIKLYQKKYTQALDSCQESLKIPIGEKLEEGIVYRILGQIFKTQNQKELSAENFLKSMNLLEQVKAKFELAKTYLEAGRAGVFPYVQRLDFLQRSKLIFRQIDFGYYLALADMGLAQVQFENQDYDEAITSLNNATMVFDELGEKKLIDKSEKLRSEIEKAISQESLSAKNEYRVFGRCLPEAEYKGIQEGDLQDALEILAKRIKADRGFVTLGGDNGEDAIASTFHLDAEKATRIISGLKSLNGGYEYLDSPTIYTKAGLLPELVGLFSQAQSKIASLISIPLRTNGELSGFLYLDRKSNGEVISSPFTSQEFNFAVAFGDLLAVKLTCLQKKKLEQDNLILKRNLEEKCSFPNIITQNQQMLEALWKVEQIKDSNLPILIEGETGTGKDLLAKAIHYTGNRKDKRFIAINCAAFPDTLLESELFGHKKGAYTGAVDDKRGLLEEADGGTLYIDEVTDMPITAQVKLLRALEDKEITRLGETIPRKTDIRVISAANKKIQEEVEAGRFRKDLYFRLNTVNVKLPPLRDRREDIPLLVEHFLKIYDKDGSKKGLSQIAPTAIELFMNYDWPGNVRELENELRKLVSSTNEKGVTCSDILCDKFCLPEKVPARELSLYRKVAMWEKHYILKTMLENNWIKKAAAAALKIPESSLRFKMKQHNISKPQ